MFAAKDGKKWIIIIIIIIIMIITIISIIIIVIVLHTLKQIWIFTTPLQSSYMYTIQSLFKIPHCLMPQGSLVSHSVEK